mgnify:CR=1 FL=1|tara:strand:+ start:5679 stop:6305 length:627 start_codon:yes stop_codon:yes gene_type:complete
MTFIIKDKSTGGGGNFEQCPAGSFRAICTSITDLGFHEQNWQGEKARDVRKLRLSFELCDEEKTDGSPFYASREVTLSLNEKAALRAIVDGWNGKAMTDAEAKDGIDLGSYLGRAAMLSITHKQSLSGNTYAAISSVSSLPKGFTEVEKPTAPLELFNMDGDRAEWQAQYDDFPEWLQGKINIIEAVPVAKSYGEKKDGELVDDDIPF